MSGGWPSYIREAVSFKTPKVADSEGCSLLAEAYRDGKGVPTNKAKAFSLYSKACEEAFAFACEALGIHVGRGDFPLAASRAPDFFKRACDLNPMESVYSCGEKYYWGAGVPKDIPRAMSLFQSACEKAKAPWACSRVKEIEDKRH
jgi:uncharacterized protein